MINTSLPASRYIISLISSAWSLLLCFRGIYSKWIYYILDKSLPTSKDIVDISSWSLLECYVKYAFYSAQSQKVFIAFCYRSHAGAVYMVPFTNMVLTVIRARVSTPYTLFHAGCYHPQTLTSTACFKPSMTLLYGRMITSHIKL